MALHSASTLDEVTDLLTEQAVSLLDADFAIFGLLPPRSRRVLRARLFCRPNGGGCLRSGAVTIAVDRASPIREAITGRQLAISEQAGPLAVGDMASAHEALAACPTAAAPIMIRGKVGGALSVSWNVGQHRVDEEDRRFLLALAHAGGIAVERSITQREQARRLDELEALNRLKSQFLSVVSHEFRTPLTSIKASIDLLGATLATSDEVTQRLLRNVGRSVERLELLVADILTMARLKSGTLQLDLQPHALHALIDETVPVIAPLLEAKGQRLSIDCPRGLPRARVDRRWLGQALLNLLSNAHKYSPRGSAISLSAGEAAEGLVLAVCDQGPGIPPEKLAQVFDEFYRVDERGGPAAGAGLGLAIAKSLVELHGGHIEAENLPGGGACFRLSIPRAGGA